MQRLEVVLVRWSVFAAAAVAVLMAPPLVAQGNPKEDPGITIPESAMPPGGMCRVWLRDVPERQQPAPTDCATALRTRPRNSILLFGDLTDGPLPKERMMAPASAASRAREFDPGRSRVLFQPVDSRSTAGRVIPAQAVRIGEPTNAQAVRGGVAGRPDQTKPTAVKRPDPPPP